MRKNEFVYRELLYQFIEKRNNRFTQLALAKNLVISISTVNNALKPLIAMGAIEIRKMSFSILDYKKLLLYWASMRNLEKDIGYKTRVETSIKNLESAMPSGVTFTAFSAYRFRFKEAAADYDEVYMYANDEAVKEIKKRFKESKPPYNLFVLKSNEHLFKTAEKGNASIAQTFVDLWNMRTWYAKEFVKSLERKIGDIVGILE